MSVLSKFRPGWRGYVMRHLDGGHELKNSGAMVSPVVNPDPESIKLSDIAHSLARQCRWGGDVDLFYSVAQHSVLVSLLLPPSLQAAGLLHDATEAYLADIPKPAKRGMPEYNRIEAKLARVIFRRFGLPPESIDQVKLADNLVLVAEARDLFSPRRDFIFPVRLRTLSKKLVTRIHPVEYLAAEYYFLDAARRLKLRED